MRMLPTRRTMRHRGVMRADRYQELRVSWRAVFPVGPVVENTIPDVADIHLLAQRKPEATPRRECKCSLTLKRRLGRCSTHKPSD
jgi:hypothetical protein